MGTGIHDQHQMGALHYSLLCREHGYQVQLFDDAHNFAHVGKVTYPHQA